ncbi:MFS transporter [Pseudomonas putida]|nr:MFS transporter [Pseudomonas putida]
MKGSSPQAWVMLGAFSAMLCISMSLPLYGGSIVNTFMAEDLGWDKQTLGLLTALNMLVNALAGPLVVNSVGKLGFKACLIISSCIMLAGGVALATLAFEPWHVLIGFSLMMGLAGSFGLIPCQAGVAAWFVEQRTLALSVLYASMGVVSFLLIALVGSVVSNGGWRLGWWVFAGAGLLGLLISLVVVRRPEPVAGRSAAADDGLMPPPPPGASATPVGIDMTFSQALRTPLLWIVTLCMLAVAAGNGFIMGHSQVHLREAGISAANAASTMSLLAIFMVAGNMGFGLLAPKLELRRAFILAMACFVCGFLVLANVSSMTMLYGYAVVTGIGFGGAQVGMMAILGHYWGTRVFPALTAFGMIIQTVGGGIVPVAAGAYFDANHNYLAVIYTIVGINVVAAITLYFSPAPRPLASHDATRLQAQEMPH